MMAMEMFPVSPVVSESVLSAVCDSIVHTAAVSDWAYLILFDHLIDTPENGSMAL